MNCIETRLQALLTNKALRPQTLYLLLCKASTVQEQRGRRSFCSRSCGCLEGLVQEALDILAQFGGTELDVHDHRRENGQRILGSGLEINRVARVTLTNCCMAVAQIYCNSFQSSEVSWKDLKKPSWPDKWHWLICRSFVKNLKGSVVILAWLSLLPVFNFSPSLFSALRLMWRLCRHCMAAARCHMSYLCFSSFFGFDIS